MVDNKIIIGKETPEKKSRDELELLKKGDLYVPEKETEEKAPASQPESLDDNLWGNDWQVNQLIDKDYLAEKRLFVRIRFFQRLECRLKCENPDSEPTKLDTPLLFNVFDLSMGGIGAICDHPVPKDSIFVFNLQLDHLSYEVKCQTVYCIPIDNIFRLGFRILSKEKSFIKHLKLFVARLSLMGSKVSFSEILEKYGTDKKL